MSLIGFQTMLGKLIRANNINSSATEKIQPLDGTGLTGDEHDRLIRLVESPGFQFTLRVQRSWCEQRTANAARLSLSILPSAERQRLVEEWVGTGGGTASFPGTEAEAFLEFIALRFAEDSHELTLARFEQAVYRTSRAAANFKSPPLSILSDPDTLLCAGKHATLVRFFAKPERLFAALEGTVPLPPILPRPYSVLFAPGLPGLFRLASIEEVALFRKLAMPIAIRVLMHDNYPPKRLETLFVVGAVEHEAEKSRHQALGDLFLHEFSQPRRLTYE
jgi:hypothetical protein